ncbi:hypothetical protein B0H12DRAFT_1240356 [Mycena haematopus]|nr:hypothetical protein B0H12DRAFT_1240356 [Mycena haematopus]
MPAVYPRISSDSNPSGTHVQADIVHIDSEVLKHNNNEKAHSDENLSVEEEANDGARDGLVFYRGRARYYAPGLGHYSLECIPRAELFTFYDSSVVFVRSYSLALVGAGGPNRQSGALGQGQQTSTGIGTFYQFWSCYITPLIGAYITNAIGHIVLVISAGIIDKSNTALGVFMLVQITMGFGTFKANISPLVAEQYRRTKLFVVTQVTFLGQREAESGAGRGTAAVDDV